MPRNVVISDKYNYFYVFRQLFICTVIRVLILSSEDTAVFTFIPINSKPKRILLHNFLYFILSVFSSLYSIFIKFCMVIALDSV